MIDTIIFDLGGVLIDWNPDYVYRHIFPDEAERRHFFENICTHEWNLEQDAGRPLQEATDLLIAQHPEWETEIKAYYGRWREMLGGPIHDSVEVLRKIKEAGEHRLYALTNWSAETFPVALELYEFLNWFEGIVVSGTEKTRKPFPEFYHILLERYEVKPKQAVFIDDNLHNVKGAEEVGLLGIHFRSPRQMEEELKRLGVLNLKPET